MSDISQISNFLPEVLILLQELHVKMPFWCNGDHTGNGIGNQSSNPGLHLGKA